MEPLTEPDQALVEQAESVIREYGAPGRHTTGAVLRTTDGSLYEGVSVKAGTAQADIHAEPVALTQAMMAGAAGFETSAAVQFIEGFSGPTRVVSACGSCRELLAEQAPGIDIVVQGDDGLAKRPIGEMLPD